MIENMPSKEIEARYTVERGIYEDKNGEHLCYFVLDYGVPAIEINRYMIPKQLRYARPVSTSCYNICRFLNTMDDMGIQLEEVTMDDIFQYLKDEYENSQKSYSTIRRYILDISDLYENLALDNHKIDQSLLQPYSGTQVRVVRNRKSTKITKVSALRRRFLPKCGSMRNYQYNKWYSEEQIEAIAAELPINHRCVFLLTVFLGYRVDSALSVTMEKLSLRERLIEPTRSKTGKTHVSSIPPGVYEVIEDYLYNYRSIITEKTGSTSDYVFLDVHGNPISYHAYNAALKRAGERAMKKNPGLGLTKLHTHAGRSTFARALRDFQLDARRNHKPGLTDDDFCTCMDWKSMQSLHFYDSTTRAQDAAPLLEDFFIKPKKIS